MHVQPYSFQLCEIDFTKKSRSSFNPHKSKIPFNSIIHSACLVGMCYINVCVNQTVLDANGRIPRGVMKGNSIDLGFYDQCLDVSEEFEESYEIVGRYCSFGFNLPLSLTSKSVKASTSTNLSLEVILLSN